MRNSKRKTGIAERLNPKLKYHLPVIILCLGIFIESSLPSDAYPEIEFELGDKIIHIAIYFFLFLASYFSFNNQNKFTWIKKYSLFSALLFTSVYGAVDELHQLFVFGRSCDFLDWVADFLGGVFGLLLLMAFKKYYKNKNNNSLKTIYDTNK